MKIEETLDTKTVVLNSSDPYYTSLEFMHLMSLRGKVIEKENRFSTEGPYHRSDVIFDLVKSFDSHSKMKITFFLTGENGKKNFLRLDIKPYFYSSIEERGFFTNLFAEFYLEHAYPIIRKMADEQISRMLELSEELIKKL